MYLYLKTWLVMWMVIYHSLNKFPKFHVISSLNTQVKHVLKFTMLFFFWRIFQNWWQGAFEVPDSCQFQIFCQSWPCQWPFKIRPVLEANKFLNMIPFFPCLFANCVSLLPDMTKGQTPTTLQQADPFHVKAHVYIDTIGAYKVKRLVSRRESPTGGEISLNQSYPQDLLQAGTPYILCLLE